MPSPEQIKSLQQQLDALRQQLKAQAQELQAMQEVLRQQAGEDPQPRHAPVRNRVPSFSLENFIGLRLIQFIGIIVLVIGLSIGVKYAIDRNLISEWARIALAYLAGFVLYGLSLRLRKNFHVFSALLFSGGMASLYFTTYAAYVYYAMFPFGISFLLMALLTVYTVYEAMRYGRQEIALLGLVGAYGIPFLISRNADRADLFFLYIALINSGVVFLCIRKIWKNVGRVAQMLTWLLFLGWASVRTHNGWSGTGLAYLIFFYLIFCLAVLSFRLFRRQDLTRNDVHQLVLNNLACYFSAMILAGVAEKGAVQVTLAVSLGTAIQAAAASRYWKREGYLLQWLASLALVLFVLYIGLNWSGFTVTLLWLLAAVVIFAWGFVRHSMTARMMAVFLIGLTLGKLLLLDSQTFSTVQKVAAYLVLGILLLVVSFFYQKFRKRLFRDEDREGHIE